MNLFFAFLLIPILNNNVNVILFETNKIECKHSIVETLYNGNLTTTVIENNQQLCAIGTTQNSIGNSNYVVFEYNPIFTIHRPNYSSVLEAQLTFNLSNEGNLNNVFVNIYSSIGQQPTLIESIGVVNVFNNQIIINLTDFLSSHNLKTFYVGLERSYSGSLGYVYNFDSENGNLSPNLKIYHAQPTIVSGIYTNAPTYYLVTSSDVEFYYNCFCYVLSTYVNGVSVPPENDAPIPDLDFYKNEVYSNELMDLILENVQSSAYEYSSKFLRAIDSYDSPLYSNEYRIAFRLILSFDETTNTYRNDNYHFIRQNLDGRWSEIYPTRVSHLYQSDFNPSQDPWTGDSVFGDVYYFAVVN